MILFKMLYEIENINLYTKNYNLRKILSSIILFVIKFYPIIPLYQFFKNGQV